MSSSRRTYDTDKIIVRTITAYDDASKPIPALRTLTAGGDGTTFWAIPSSLGGFPAYNNVIVNNTALVADLSYNTLTINSVQGIGINVAGKELTFFNKGFTEFDISGGNTLVGYSNQTVTPTVKFVGTNGIRLSSDPLTNTFYIQGTTAAISSGVYAYAQLNVISNASTLTTEAIGNSNNTYLTATSVSTVLNVIGIGDIQLATNTTSNAYFISISSFTSEGYLALSSLAYNIYGSTMSTVSSLFYDIPMTGIATSSLLGFTSNVSTGIHQQFIYDQQNVMLNYTPIGKYNALSNIVIIGFPSTVAGLGSAQYVSTPSLTSTVAGLGTAGYVSTASLVSTVDSIFRTGINNIIASTVTGLGSSDYVSTASLVSSVKGLGVAGYVSTASLLSTVAGMGTAGYMSTVSLVSTVAGLGAAGYLSTASLISTVTGLNEFISSFIDPTELTSTVVGLATNTFVSTTGVTSTVAGLGSSGYVSSLSLASSLRGLGSLGYVSTGSLISSVAGLGSAGYVSTTYLNSVATSTVTGLGSSGYVSTASLVSSLLGLGSIGYVSSFSNIPYISAQQFMASSIGVNCNVPRATLDVNGQVNVSGSSSNYWLLFGTSTNSNTIARSYNRSTWTIVGADTGAFTNIATAGLWDGSKWLAVGQGGGGSSQSTIKYSYDAINWSNVTSGAFANSPTSISYNNKLYLALASITASDSNTMKYSYDGLNWSNCVFADSPFYSIASGAAWNGNMWVVKGNDGISDYPFDYYTTSTIKYSYDGITWSNSLSGGFTNNSGSFSGSVAWNGNMWIAVANGSYDGTGHSLQYSYDGKNWNCNMLNPDFSAKSIAWNGSMWVRIGNRFGDSYNGIGYSYNGMNWNEAQINGGSTVPSDNHSIVWNGEQWLVTSTRQIAGVQYSNYITRSTDGIIWTATRLVGILSNGGLAYKSNINPAILTNNIGIYSYNTPNFLTTSTHKIMGFSSTLNIDNVLYINNSNNNVGINNPIANATLDVYGTANITSTLFTNTTSSLAGNFSSINSGIINTSNLYASVDVNTEFVSTSGLTAKYAGINCNAAQSNLYTLDINGNMNVSGYYSSNLMVALGYGDSGFTYFIYSYNGIDWLGCTNNGTQFVSGTNLGFVAWNGRSWLAGGDATGQGQGGLEYSSNVIEWQDVPNLTGNLYYCATWIAPNWIIGASGTGDGNTMFSMDENYNITPIGAVLPYDCRGIAWNGQYAIAVGDNTDSLGGIRSSPDGITWGPITSGGFSSTSDTGYGVAWNGFMWVIVGSGANIKYSTDRNGANWSNADTSFTTAGYGVAWNGLMWVAVGDDGISGIKYSYNGINWSNAVSGGFGYLTGRSVSWNGSVWIAVGRGASGMMGSIQYSSDGMNWSESGVFSSVIGGIGVAYNQPFVADINTSTMSLYLNNNQPSFTDVKHKIVAYEPLLSIDDTLFINKYTNNIGIKNTNPQYTLDVNGTINASDTIRAFSGVLSNGTFLTSDSNVKENISSADLSICYSNTKNLPLHRFNFISTLAESKIDKGQIGFIAQEVSTIFPKSLIQMYEESVSSSVYQMNYDQIFLSHYGATQLLMSTVEGQQAQINEMSNLLARVAAQVFSQ